MSKLNDEQQLVRNMIIQKALTQRYVNVNRMLRDLRIVDDSYIEDDDKVSIKDQLQALIDKKSDAKSSELSLIQESLNCISDRLDKNGLK